MKRDVSENHSIGQRDVIQQFNLSEVNENIIVDEDQPIRV